MISDKTAKRWLKDAMKSAKEFESALISLNDTMIRIKRKKKFDKLSEEIYRTMSEFRELKKDYAKDYAKGREIVLLIEKELIIPKGTIPLSKTYFNAQFKHPQIIETALDRINKLNIKPKKMTRRIVRIRELEETVHLMKIEEINTIAVTNSLKKEIDEHLQRIEKLEFQVNNPFKFQIGDKVGNFDILSRFVLKNENKKKYYLSTVPLFSQNKNKKIIKYNYKIARYNGELDRNPFENHYKVKSKGGMKIKTEKQLQKIQNNGKVSKK